MWVAALQGLIQGLTEFLPISSSGHLVLTQRLFNFSDLDPSYNIFVQGGTVLSICLFYGRRVISLTKKYFWYLILASFPAVVAGLFLESYVDALFSSLAGAALGFFLTTIIVWLSRFAPQSGSILTSRKATYIGLAQALAILPGLSRSGTTITAALFSKLSPQEAFDFSFILSIPIVTGAALIGAKHITWNPTQTPVYFLGFFVAAVSGYFALKLLTHVVAQGKLYLFAPYTLALSLLALFLSI